MTAKRRPHGAILLAAVAGVLGGFLLYASVGGPKAEAWWWSAVGAAVNAVTGNKEAPLTPEEKAERAKHKSLAEQALGTDKEGGARSIADAAKDPKLLHELEKRAAAPEAAKDAPPAPEPPKAAN